MNDDAARIVRLEHRVMWRTRLLSLQDGLMLAVVAAGLIAAAFVVLARLRPMTMLWPAVVIVTLGLALAAALIRWFLTRTDSHAAAFLIDESLKLDDRVATAHSIIKRGGPATALEEALIEDAAAKVGSHRPAYVVPFRARRWYALSLVSVIGLVAAFMVPARSIPIAQTLAAERADIESAGQQLEESATEIEQTLPSEAETAALAKEQAEIGRGFRRAAATRAEALRRLSAIEERISKRHSDLASTRAEEIVSLADGRLGNALSTLSKPSLRKTGAGDSQVTPQAQADSSTEASKNTATRGANATARNDAGKAPGSQESTRKPDRPDSRPQSKAGEPNANTTSADSTKRTEPQKGLQQPVSGNGNRNADSAKNDSGKPDQTATRQAAADSGVSPKQNPSDPKLSDSPAGDSKPEGEKGTDQRKSDDRSTPELSAGSLEALKAVPDSLAQQAAKSLPNISQELLKKAAELRGKQLTPADIEKLRKAAEALAGDLTKIEQSKELQKALQEMAREVRPEQLEQVARQLGEHEQLKQELDAAARLLSENQQAKDTVAGLAGELARRQDQKRQRDGNQRGAGNSDAAGGDSRTAADSSRRVGENADPLYGKAEADRRVSGQGRESSLKGKLQQGSGGEYLYMQSKAGVGAARAPYSTAYPQYRREAERSVQRSHVPPNMRSVVRKYFDAINPDARRP